MLKTLTLTVERKTSVEVGGMTEEGWRTLTGEIIRGLIPGLVRGQKLNVVYNGREVKSITPWGAEEPKKVPLGNCQDISAPFSCSPQQEIHAVRFEVNDWRHPVTREIHEYVVVIQLEPTPVPSAVHLLSFSCIEPLVGELTPGDEIIVTMRGEDVLSVIPAPKHDSLGNLLSLHTTLDKVLGRVRRINNDPGSKGATT